MIWIYLKRCLRHTGIVLMLLTVPALAFMFRGFAETEIGAMVGLFCEGRSAEAVVEQLELTEGYITFVRYDDYEQMKNHIETQRLECGFVLPENIADIKNAGRIVCGRGYSSVLAPATKEAVFAAVLKVYGGDIALDFARENGLEISDEKFNSAYQKYLEEIRTAVEFEEISLAEQKNDTTTVNRLINCIICIFMLWAVLMGCVLWIRDKNNGIRLAGEMNIAAMLVLMLAAVVVSLAVMKQKIDIVRLIMLAVGLFGVGCAVTALLKSERAIWCIMPFAIMAVAVFDLVNISAFVSQLGVVDYLLLSHYFVYADLPQLVLSSVILLILGGTADKLLDSKEI